VQLTPLVLSKSKITLREKDDYKRLFDTPSYFIGAENDLISYQMSKELFAWNDNENFNYNYLKIKKHLYLSLVN
jgi:hypothetical protein